MGIATTVLTGLGSKALDYVDTAVQYYNQKKLNRQAEKDTQQNMRLAHDLNLQSVADSYVQSIAGMRRAGINPSQAVGNTNNAVGVSAHAGNAGVAAKPENSLPASLEAGNALAQQESQIENTKANTELLKEQTREKRIENNRKSTEDNAVGQNLPFMLAEMRDSTDSPFIRGFIDQFEQSLSADDINLGQLNAFSKLFFDFSQRERDRELDFISKEMDKKVLSMQYDNGTAEALADMSKATRLQLYRNIALMQAQIGQLESETSLTEDKRAAIRASIAKLGQEVQSLLHHDPAAMWKAGDISGLLVSLGYDGIKAAATGAGYGAAMYATRGAGVPSAAGGAVKTAGTQAKLGSASLASKGSKPIPSNVLDGIKASCKRQAEGNKVYEARLFDASVRKWRAEHGY